MSTRACVSIRNEDGSVLSIYQHWDGYPEGLGESLKGNYTNIESVRELIEMGDASVIGDTLTDCIFYNRDRGDDWNDVKPLQVPKVQDLLEHYPICEYFYVFEDNQWTTYTYSEVESISKQPTIA
jgi:hypothetical protein